MVYPIWIKTPIGTILPTSNNYCWPWAPAGKNYICVATNYSALSYHAYSSILPGVKYLHVIKWVR